MKDVKPMPDGDSTKVKVKVRVNLNGMVGVVGASTSEKREGGDEEEIQNAKGSGNGDAAKTNESNEPMDTDGQQQTPQENGEVETGEKVNF